MGKGKDGEKKMKKKKKRRYAKNREEGAENREERLSTLSLFLPSLGANLRGAPHLSALLRGVVDHPSVWLSPMRSMSIGHLSNSMAALS